MTAFNYTLESPANSPGGRKIKVRCPSCGRTTFTRYVDNRKAEYLPEKYGRCDRENKCGYSFSPYHDDYAKSDGDSRYDHYLSQLHARNQRKLKRGRRAFIPNDMLKELRPEGHEEFNTLANYLTRNAPYPVDRECLQRVFDLYQVGTVTRGYRFGACGFPYIDNCQRIRAIQFKKFDKSGHTLHASNGWLHSDLKSKYETEGRALPGWLTAYLRNSGRVTCLFGAHLLGRYPTNPIALVEAPKTALIGTLYYGFPDNSQNFLWLAVFNKSSLSIDKFRVLQDRQVTLFPDVSKDGSTFREWERKAKQFVKQLSGRTVAVCDNYLEEIASPEERKEGADLADYLLPMDWRDFRLR